MAGRPSRTRRLDVWMNGELVGQWSVMPTGIQRFAYDAAWQTSVASRPLSLSLPMDAGTAGLKGPAVASYFDNLLPDSTALRARLASRHGAASDEAFDLLEKIGRDCVGAVQILPAGSSPPDVKNITSRPLTEAEVESHLDAVVTGASFGAPFEDELRISIAGAQEKTALLYNEGRWQLPLSATPTTHILKLPMGEVGSIRADFSTSVENEWLCSKIMQAYGIPTANCTIVRFGRHKVLVVERFDRRWVNGSWIARLPQEDFCQVFGCGSWQKYEEQGGPGMNQILDTLRGSDNAQQDRDRFLSAQILFWMLCAPDGHAKNFSIRLLPRGAFVLTPLYDVMSAWPVIGKGPSHFQLQKVKLAMAVRSKNTHYRIQDIQRRHWSVVAKHNAIGNDFEAQIETIVSSTPRVVEAVTRQLPTDFPMQIAESIFKGLQLQAQYLEKTAKA